MKSEIKTYTYPNGEIQRIQLVHMDDWGEVNFLRPRRSEEALEQIAAIYRTYLVPACPWIFGQMVLFALPEHVETQIPTLSKKYGELSDPLTAAAALLESGVKIRRGKSTFSNNVAKELWQELEEANCVQLVSGRAPFTKIIPVGRELGRMTETRPDAALKVNATFFVMDCFDCATAYDSVGTPIGLCVKDGVIMSPPLYHREALLVKENGSVAVTIPKLEELSIEIAGRLYLAGENAQVYTRPEHKKTPRGAGRELVIIGNRIVAVHEGGGTPIPTSGFVLRVDEACHAKPGEPVVYCGMEDILFGIQVGNSIIRDGVKTSGFRSPFYNIRSPFQRVPFPPSLYPLDFQKARAARVALGADAEGKPLLLWVEGAGKLRYEPGRDSCGASLAKLGKICAELGMMNAVNLDGGGSAQILLRNARSLLISDRNPTDNSEMERVVPLGLLISDF